jgi:hypothetical protein
MDRHEIVEFVREWLAMANCGVDLPRDMAESLEYQDVFASALFEAIYEECNKGGDRKTVFKNLHTRLQWMAAIVTQLALEMERKRDEVAAKRAASHR